MSESEEELKSHLIKAKEESEKAGLKLNSQNTKIMKKKKKKKLRLWHLVPSPHGNSMGNDGNSDRLYFLGLQNHCRW